MTTITELLSAATAAGEAERARYRRFIEGETGDGTPVWVVASETNDVYHCFGTEADCQRYIAKQGNRSVFAYLADHAHECNLDCVLFDEGMRLLAGAGEGETA